MLSRCACKLSWSSSSCTGLASMRAGLANLPVHRAPYSSAAEDMLTAAHLHWCWPLQEVGAWKPAAPEPAALQQLPPVLALGGAADRIIRPFQVSSQQAGHWLCTIAVGVLHFQAYFTSSFCSCVLRLALSILQHAEDPGSYFYSTQLVSCLHETSYD
jgi:hypothetical protein